jgi:hypothetical protein
MASLRGSQVLWTAQTVNQNDTSPEAFVGTATNVVVMIKNTGANAATFKIQVAAPAAVSAGRNTDPVSTEWYDLSGQTAIAVAVGAQVAVNLSPFAPPYLRLNRTDATGVTTISASVAGLSIT